MRVLVTGANGYIGQGVTKKLLELEYEVIATDVRSTNIPSGAKVIETDLFSVKDPWNYFEKPDVLVHLAWRDGFEHNSLTHINDMPKHYNFIDKITQSDMKRICVMGSMHEVGFYEGSISENTPCNPQSLYGISKNALRLSMTLLAKERRKELLWLRGYYIVGNSHYGSSIFSKITAAEEKGLSEFPFTLGQNQFDFIDYDILCSQVVTALLQNKVLGIIECCSGRPEKLADRVERFIRENNYKIKLVYGKFPDRPYDSKAVWGDNHKINLIMERAK